MDMNSACLDFFRNVFTRGVPVIVTVFLRAFFGCGKRPSTESRQRTASHAWSNQATMDGFLNPIGFKPGDWVGFRHPDGSDGRASTTLPALLPGGDGENNF